MSVIIEDRVQHEKFFNECKKQFDDYLIKNNGMFSMSDFLIDVCKTQEEFDLILKGTIYQFLLDSIISSQ